ncbi:hypothetical protein BUALT_Bualt03G0138600 [Buddleja alternifolia]|uniref:Uncharacterized protein n=1 Tax=Buddleja alternifolia TaxID=168488 RepID=A0AAV6XUI4_9LAMI|nr:hypothetical protein BUALT_Bualt03G0138600 [Buddleja alternifolia]
MMFPNKRAVLNLRNGGVHANPLYFLIRNKYVAGFTSTSDINKGTTTPDKLSNKDATVEGSEGSYGGFGIFSDEDEVAEGSKGGYGGSGIPNKGDKSGATRRNNIGERRTEDMDTAEIAKAGVVGAMETGLKLGEIAKQTMDGMWDAAKKTTESVRDSMADDSGGNDRDRRQSSDDKHVEDLRRWSRGTDLNAKR